VDLLGKDGGSVATRDRTQSDNGATARGPPAIHNTKVAGRHVDAFWPPALAVEVDSFKFHGTTPRKFRNDYDKTAALDLAGVNLMRQLVADRR
jgi:hypothetical protein